MLGRLIELARKMVSGILDRVVGALSSVLLGPVFKRVMDGLDGLLNSLSPLIRRIVDFLEPFTDLASPLLTALIPRIKTAYMIYNPLMDGLDRIAAPLGRVLRSFVERADPSIFEV
jgi:uncharacterized membrane protein required for colicin V production